MRPIKFRAWFKDIKKMGQPFNPFLEPMMWGFEGDNVELMQFTGLLDKNGREIYEGDLIRSLSGFLWKCSFANGRFFLLSVGKDLFPDNSFDDKGYNTYLEVIGNVWENPELLEVQKP